MSLTSYPVLSTYHQSPPHTMNIRSFWLVLVVNFPLLCGYIENGVQPSQALTVVSCIRAATQEKRAHRARADANSEQILVITSREGHFSKTRWTTYACLSLHRAAIALLAAFFAFSVTSGKIGTVPRYAVTTAASFHLLPPPQLPHMSPRTNKMVHRCPQRLILCLKFNCCVHAVMEAASMFSLYDERLGARDSLGCFAYALECRVVEMWSSLAA